MNIARRVYWVVLASAGTLAACSGASSDKPASSDNPGALESPRQAALPQRLCEVLPQADAERIMGKSLVEKRNDDGACHYGDAKGTGGTGLFLDANALQVADQCRLIPGAEPLSGVGRQACISFGRPAASHTTVVFSSGGRTFEATAPGLDRSSERASAVAKAVIAKLGP